MGEGGRRKVEGGKEVERKGGWGGMTRKERDKEVTVGKMRMNGSGESTGMGGMKWEGSSGDGCGREWRREWKQGGGCRIQRG